LAFKEYKRISKKSKGFLTPEDLLEEIKKNEYKPVMIFFGTEKMRIENAVDYIKRSLLGEKSNEFNYEVIYCEEGNGVGLYQSFVTPSFMGGKKLIVAREAEKLKDDDYSDLMKMLRFEKFNGILIILIYYSDDLPLRGKNISAFHKELNVRKGIYKFDILSNLDLSKRVRNYLKKYGMSLDNDAFEYLIQELGSQQDVVFNILSQLIMYEPSRKRITLSDIKDFIFNFRGFTVYDFTNAIANKRADEALRIIEISGNTRDNMIQLVVPIMRMLEQLYTTKSLLQKNTRIEDIARELNIPVRIVEDEFIPQARNFDKMKLLRSMEFMSRFDLLLRTSTLSCEMIISNLVLDLCL